jgi:hypothetical protein
MLQAQIVVWKQNRTEENLVQRRFEPLYPLLLKRQLPLQGSICRLCIQQPLVRFYLALSEMRMYSMVINKTIPHFEHGFRV